MAKQVRRIIIVTIIETWTLIWNDPIEPGAGLPAHTHHGGQTTVAQIVTVSSSRATVALPESTVHTLKVG
jgi:hypothetical protein